MQVLYSYLDLNRLYIIYNEKLSKIIKYLNELPQVHNIVLLSYSILQMWLETYLQWRPKDMHQWKKKFQIQISHDPSVINVWCKEIDKNRKLELLKYINFSIY
jgi:hypothetical protein